MEAVINGNMLSARKYFSYICMNEVGYNWKCDEPPLGGDSPILILLDLLSRLVYTLPAFMLCEVRKCNLQSRLLLIQLIFYVTILQHSARGK